MLKPLAASALAAALALPAFAQDHSAHGAPAASGRAVEGYMAANDTMHRDMGAGFTGDPDIDFARGMIPHHQGAIDMAEVMLEYGTDPALRAMAAEIIAAQEAEIAVLEAWLAEHAAE